MKPSSENIRLAKEIRARLDQLTADLTGPKSDLNLAFKVKDAGAFQFDTSLGKPANDLSAAP